jgi:Flp pilus assembly protein TadD
VRYHQAGRFAEAKRSYLEILSGEPKNATALHYLGLITLQEGDARQATKLIERSIALRPDRAAAYSDLGLALKNQGWLEAAVAGYRKALELKPDYAEAYSNLGNALTDQGRLEAAVAAHRKALELRPEDPGMHKNIGLALRYQGNLEQAAAAYQKALELNPDDAEAHSNLGNALKDQGRLEAAVAAHRKALEVKPDYARAHYNMSFSLLLIGRMGAALDEYEWRWRLRTGDAGMRAFAPPMWDGLAELTDRTILLWPEQGPQDVTIWASCVPEVIARAGRCILECHPKLVRLFARSFAMADVRADSRASDSGAADFDLHLPLGSLFRNLRPDLALDPRLERFLVPDPDRVAFWKARLASLGRGPFVGISWKSPLMSPDRSPNYTEIGDWMPVFRNVGAVFVNLQCGGYRDELAEAKREFGVTVHDFEDLDLYDDLDDVAALAAALDVAISVSTAVAAIAAGVGTPTWVVSWRQSSWNNILFAPRGPSVTFFQRDSGETWNRVFAAIAETLQDLVDARAGGAEDSRSSGSSASS